MDGRFDADPVTLEQVARRLRGAAMDLDATPAPPPAPEVGPCTAGVAAVLAFLTGSAAGVCEGIGVAGEAVERSHALYAQVDAGEAGSLRFVGE